MLQEESQRSSKGFSGSFYTRFVSGAGAMIAGMMGITFAAAVHVARRYYDSNAERSSHGIMVALFLCIFFLAMFLHRWRIRQLLKKHQIDAAFLGEMSSMLVSATTAFCVLAGMFLRR